MVEFGISYFGPIFKKEKTKQNKSKNALSSSSLLSHYFCFNQCVGFPHQAFPTLTGWGSCRPGRVRAQLHNTVPPLLFTSRPPTVLLTSWLRIRGAQNPCQGFNHLLEGLIELKKTFYLLDDRFMIKKDTSQKQADGREAQGRVPGKGGGLYTLLGHSAPPQHLHVRDRDHIYSLYRITLSQRSIKGNG